MLNLYKTTIAFLESSEQCGFENPMKCFVCSCHYLYGCQEKVLGSRANGSLVQLSSFYQDFHNQAYIHIVIFEVTWQLLETQTSLF